MALCLVSSHVGIAGNEAADTAAKDAMISIPQADTQPLPYKDFYVSIKETIRGAWQEFWLNHCRPNKLLELKPTISEWGGGASHNRTCFHEFALCRLRKGHIVATHGHLVENRPTRYCDDCLVPLNVVHLLTECPTLQDIRYQCFNSRQLTITTVLGNKSVDTNKLMDFIKKSKIVI